MRSRRAAVAVALSVVFVYCSTRPPDMVITPEVQNAIAACSGGYTAVAASELRAEFEERGGSVIASGESSTGAVSPFRFGDLQGEEAVAAYNLYVQCINGRTRSEAPTEDPAPSRDVTIQCFVGNRYYRGTYARDYTCVLQNHTGYSRWCELTSECIGEGGVFYGYDSARVIVPAHDTGRVNGTVYCGRGPGGRRIRPNLTCGG